MRRCNYNLHGGSRDDGLTGGSKYYSWRNFSATDQVWSLVTVRGPGLAIFTLGTCYETTDGAPGERKRTIKCLYLHRDHVSLLVGHGVLGVGVLADHAVQAAVGHLGVSGA